MARLEGVSFGTAPFDEDVHEDCEDPIAILSNLNKALEKRFGVFKPVDPEQPVLPDF